jgi:hypothetical protein
MPFTGRTRETGSRVRRRPALRGGRTVARCRQLPVGQFRCKFQKEKPRRF